MSILLIVLLWVILMLFVVRPERPCLPLDERFKKIHEAFRGLLGDRRELVLFVMFEAAMIAVAALLIATLGLQAGFAVLLAMVAALVWWAMRPPPLSR